MLPCKAVAGDGLRLHGRGKFLSDRRNDDEGAGGDTVRLDDVAREAGVAISTVSRALNNPMRVNAKTRNHVRMVAERLGYAGNIAARRLRSGLSRVVLVVTPPWTDTNVLGPALRAIDHELMRSGYSMIVGALAEDRSADPRIINMARGGYVDGILAITNDPPLDGGGLPILSAGLPSVGLLNDLSRYGVTSLVTTERSGMRDLTADLIRRGRRHLAFVSGPPSYHNTEREAGFREAIEKSGLPIESVTIEGDWSYDSGVRAAEQFLALDERPVAAVLTNDRMAIAFIKILREAGLNVPRDVAVTGFDDIGAAAYCDPPLTTYRQPMERLGVEGARLLMRLISGEERGEAVCHHVAGHIVRRQSG